jgi:alpha-tubulin suppressor-like RCC1 family protein
MAELLPARARKACVWACALAVGALSLLAVAASARSSARPRRVLYALSKTLTATSISAGDGHTCASMETGEVDCWGIDYVTKERSNLPVAVAGVTGAIAVRAGKGFNCALLASGRVECWGDDGYGQLGDGRTEDSAAPVAVVGVAGAVAVSTGSYHACAVLDSGAVVCWGRNVRGALGDGALGNSSVAVPVRGITDAVAVSAGNIRDETCALLADGHVRCWGAGARGQLGNASRRDSAVPVEVAGLGAAAAVAAGGEHACAVVAGGAVECWGAGARGQLGDGTRRASALPVLVTGLAGARAVAVDPRGYSCAVLGSGAVYCWGFNRKNQLGDGRWPLGSSVPVRTVGISNAVAVTAGRGHACALLATGAADCWGYDDYGQLGKGGGRPSICNATAVRFPAATPNGGAGAIGAEPAQAGP